MVTRLKQSYSASAVQVVSDRRLAECAKWRPYAGVGPAGQAIADTTTPRACWLAYLLCPRQVSPRPFARTERSASAVAEQAAPSPSSFAAVKTPLPASPRLHLLPPELVHLTTEPESRGSRHSSSSPQRSSIASGVGGEPAVANHHRSSLPPFSPFPQFPCELLMLTLGLGQTAMA